VRDAEGAQRLQRELDPLVAEALPAVQEGPPRVRVARRLPQVHERALALRGEDPLDLRLCQVGQPGDRGQAPGEQPHRVRLLDDPQDLLVGERGPHWQGQYGRRHRAWDIDGRPTGVSLDPVG
jgi:hypothetical protein